MTKIKNTKKGMAKKTLSMSLVVAMLATSNVPVWAAEFSDGTDAAVTSEAEAPSATTDFSDDTTEIPSVEKTESPMAQAVVESDDLSVDVSVTESVQFTGKVNVSGTIKNKKTGTDLTSYDYAWRVAGDNVAISTGHVSIAANATDEQKKAAVAGMGFTAGFAADNTSVDWSKYVGKKLELYIFNNATDGDNTKIDPTVIGATTITKKDVSKATMKLSTKATVAGTPTVLTYNGKSFYYSDSSVADDNAVFISSFQMPDDEESINVAWFKKYFDISASKSAKNANETLTVTATPKADAPFSGTAINVSLTVQKRPFNASEFDLALATGVSYQYTGSQITVPVNKLTLKENAETLSGADLSVAIKSAKTLNSTIGASNVEVTLDTTKMPNFSFDSITTPVTMRTSDETDVAKVNIEKRDLKNNCKVSINHGRVQKNTSIANFVKNYLELKDEDGTALSLNEGTDYTITCIDPDKEVETVSFRKVGTYKVTIQAIETTGNTCINGQTFEVEVAGNVIASATCSNNYYTYYTGTAITPSQSDLGVLTINGASNSADPSTDTTVDTETLRNDQWTITGYEKNTDAGTAYAIVKIGGNSTYANQTVKVPFTIKPLIVSEATVTVPKTITYNKGYSAASDYQVPLVVTAKDPSGKIVKGLSSADYTIAYEYTDPSTVTDAITKAGTHNVKHNKIKATVTILNKNFIASNDTLVLPIADTAKHTEIVAKALNNDMIKLTPDTYTYTGGNIIPEFYVTDGAFVLNEGKATNNNASEEYEVVSVTDNLNVGTGKVTIAGINDNYSGTASAEFKITAANTSDVKVTIAQQKYTGKAIRPRTFKATLNGNDVTDQFEIVSFGENVEAGKGTVVLRPVDGNKNFTGGNITAEFKIYKEAVAGEIKVYNSNGIEVNTANDSNAFEFDGTAKTFATERISGLTVADEEGNTTTTATKATSDDFEIKYAENITGVPTKNANGVYEDYNTAYVYAVAKDGTGYTGNKKFTLADGTVIKDVVAYTTFKIKNVEFGLTNVSVKNGTYAGGLPVKPEVLVQIKGQTLVEGKDYKLTFYNLDDTSKEVTNCTDVTDGKVYGVTVTGIGGYTGSKVDLDTSWGIDKKDIKDCDVKVINGVTTVMNGYIPVPTTEYTVKDNGDKTYTVTANTASKSYTGSKTVTAEGKSENEKPDAPMISSVKVVGNKATVILSGDSNGAAGYDYVISTDRDCITNKDYTSVNKNQVQTSTTFKYVQQETYYAYCHAWKRDENGKKVFSDWSNAYPFVVSAITPDAPVITNVKVSGSTIKVTYKAAANATGYDVVLGTSSKKENGETRPYNYGAHKVLNLKEGTVTATFKNVPKGTWTVGMHAFNRTSEDGKKVFSPWSNLKKATVK